MAEAPLPSAAAPAFPAAAPSPAPAAARILLAAALLFLAAAAAAALQPAAKTAPAALPTAEEAVRGYYEGDIEKSILAFESILGSDPRDGGARRQLIELYREIGDYERVVTLLGESWRLAEDGPAVERRLFIALCLAGRTEKAAAILPLSAENAETVFYEALLARDGGEKAKAADLLRKSLRLDERRPMAWYFLGEVLAETSPAEAEAAFRIAMKQDPSLTAALVPLAETVLAQGRAEDAFNLFLRARTVQPQRTGLAERIDAVKALLPDIGTRWAEAAARKRETAAPPRAEPSGAGDAAPRVRVGLAEGLGSVTVKTGADFTLRTGSSPDDPPAARGGRHEILRISSRNGGLEILRESGEPLLAAASSVSLEYDDPAATTLVFDFVSEAGSFFSVTEDRSYRGRIEFRPAPAGITLINILDIEAYLYGVLPAEMPPSWPAEALKAQAVAARSYTLAYLGTYESRGFDVHGSVLSAAYRGVGGERKTSTEAVDATRGIYMTAGGRPLRAYYSANHGGYSEDSRFVWGADADMQAVPDKLVSPRDAYLPIDDLALWITDTPSSYAAVDKLHTPAAYRWEKWIPASDIAGRVAADADVGRILKIVTRGRGISGRVGEVEVAGTAGSARIKGDRIRSRLGGLRSSLFVVRPKMGPDGFPEYFIFHGAGWGHGVGLDQSGAAGMARAGYTAGEILRHYYPKAERAGY